MTIVPCQPGDYVVIANGHRYEVVKVRKITPSKVLTNHVRRSDSYRDKHNRAESVLFASPSPSTAAGVAERLNSSRALHNEEVRSSRVRHETRVEDILRKAR